MNINARQYYRGLNSPSNRFLQRMLSPLCGINPKVIFISRGRESARILSAAANLTGVHLLNKSQEPKKGAYHIGANGIYVEEAMIRVLSESVERYSHMTIEVDGRHKMLFASYDDMLKRNDPILPTEKFNYFMKQQLTRKGFPYQRFTTQAPLTWVQTTSLISKHKIWVPAELLFIGYKIKANLGEPFLASATTIGTASHTSPVLALRSALLELIQVDSTMGHWYTGTKTIKIEFDDRTRPLENLLRKYDALHSVTPTFYHLNNPDLPGIYFACVLEKASLPKVSVGHGSVTRLIECVTSRIEYVTG